MTIKVHHIEVNEELIAVCSDQQLKRLAGDERQEAQEAYKELLHLLPAEDERQSESYELRKYTAGEFLQAKNDYTTREKGFVYVDYDRINPRLLALCLGKPLAEIEAFSPPLLNILVNEMEMLSNPNPFSLKSKMKGKEKPSQTPS